MDLAKGLEKLILAGGLAFPTCRCGAEKVATEICISAEEEAEDTNRSLREVSLEYAWPEMNRATAGFSAARVIGRGRHGTVFEGRLEEGMDVAVKVIDDALGTSMHEEVRLLSRCHHPNVVMLLGFACDSYQNHQALVYELLGGGSAFSRLHTTAGWPFKWEDRLKTGIHISRALAHLHKLKPEVFHRDVKSAAILFTPGGVAKLADFQYACTSKTRVHQYSSGACAVGTSGYCAPEYADSGFPTEASELYAMGVVLLELLTGRLPASFQPDGVSCVYLVNVVRPEAVANASDRLLSLLDPEARWPEETAAGTGAFALQCLHQSPEKRPTFLEMVTVLQHVSQIADHMQWEATGSSSSRPVLVEAEACVAGSAASPTAAGAQLGAQTATVQAMLLPPMSGSLPAAAEKAPATATTTASSSDESDGGKRPDGSWFAPLSSRRLACGPPPAAGAPAAGGGAWEEAPRPAPCPEPPQGAGPGGAPEACQRQARPEAEDRPTSDCEPIVGVWAPIPPQLLTGAAAEDGARPREPAPAGASAAPDLAAESSSEAVSSKEAADDSAPALQVEAECGAGTEPPRNWLQNLRRRSLGSSSSPCDRFEHQPDAEAAKEAGLSTGSEAEVDAGGRQWLRPWQWPRGGQQADSSSEVDPEMNRWDIRDKAEAAISRWDFRDKAEAVMSKLDLRARADPEASGEPRRWLQSWIRPPQSGTQAAGQEVSRSKAEDEVSSGDEASSEDEGERRRWLQGWKWPQQPAAPARSRRALEAEAAPSAAAEATPGAALQEDAPCGQEELTSAVDAEAQPCSPDRAAIGRLFHISDLVE